MQDYLHKSIYECQRPLLLNTDVATSPDRVPGYRYDPKKRQRVATQYYASYRRVALPLRCGKCPACRKMQNDQWFLRLYHHYLGDTSVKMCFVTLTFTADEYRHLMSHYVDIPLDEYNGADYRPVFRHYIVPLKKRLRASEKMEFDFFCVSEFGEEYGRFHFHICLFLRNSASFLSAASNYNARHPYSKHYIKSKNGIRLQTDLESYLQHIFERQWSSERHTSLSDRYVTERKGRHRRVTAKRSYGNVTLFIADGVGMLKYMTNYTVKCLHDGVTTYHRQTPGLGKLYAKDNLAELIFADTLPVCFAGKVNGRSLFIPTPRAYFRWFGDKAKMIGHFWSYYPNLVSSWNSTHPDRFITLTE